MKLKYDNITRRTMNTEGVDIKVSSFGDTDSVEWLSRQVMGYFHLITDALVKNGYVRRQSIFGAPYDFRKAPSKL